MDLARLKHEAAGLSPAERKELAEFLVRLAGKNGPDSLREEPAPYAMSWIVSDPDHLAGSRRVKGTRIPVALILECFAAGLSVGEIVDAYPSLSTEAVRGVLLELGRELQPVVA